jgi:HAD superfamily hydrolase (TIGR01509 family)
MTRAVPLRLAVFDLDGTLVDSLPLVLAAIAHAVEPYGGKPTMEIFAKLGGPPERFLGDLVGDLRHVPVAMERLECYHRENAHLIQPYAGANDALERLRRAGVRLALWTGRDRASAAWLLREHQLERFFDVVVCGDDLPSHKPDPAGLRHILETLTVKPEETLFVGDADVDVLGGVACGVDTLLIRHSRTVEKAISARSWRTVASPLEAFEAVLACLAKIT